MLREARNPESKGPSPAGTAIHTRNAEPRPQMSPAPGLSVLLENNKPKTSPNNAARSRSRRVQGSSAPFASKPPAKPVTRPSKASIRTGECIVVTSCPDAISFVSWSIVQTLFQINGLNDVTRKKELDRPIHQDANLTFRPRQLCEIDPSPHGPCQQAGKTQRFAAGKGNRQFGASRLVADDTKGAK